MTRRSNQEIERYYFDLFRRVYPLPEGQIKYGDKPDVIIEGQRKIGIEVTNLFLQSGERSNSKQKQSKIREHVLQEAQRNFVVQGGKRFEISFSFNSEFPIQKKKKLIPKLVELAKRVEAFESGEVLRGVYQDIPELSFVYVNPRLYPDPKWRAFQVYSGQIMSLERLTDVLKSKEKKAKYYTPCDAYWLLVVVDFINPAQDQEIRIDNIKLQCDVFEKIIIYKTAFEHLVEITTERIAS
jgi:hypothetical protein